MSVTCLNGTTSWRVPTVSLCLSHRHTLFIYMHMHIYMTYLTPISKSYLLLYLYASTTFISSHSLIFYQLFFLILSVYNVRYTVCGRMVPREAKVPARIPLRTARHHGACAMLVLTFMRASSQCRDTVQLTHTRMRASLLIQALLSAMTRFNSIVQGLHVRLAAHVRRESKTCELSLTDPVPYRLWLVLILIISQPIICQHFLQSFYSGVKMLSRIIPTYE